MDKPMTEEEQRDTAFYDVNFAASSDDLNRTIRRAAFGEDIGQFSWTTADEHRRFQQKLGIDADSQVLEVACGSGGPALFLVRSTGCRVIGVDLHAAGVATANEAAARDGLSDNATFLVHDARDPLPFDTGAFDAIISIDSINHIFARAAMFEEWWRVLRPGGRAIYTDAVVVTGPLRRDEILGRSPSMGEFVFTPYGADEPLLAAAGFVDILIEDVTDNIAMVAGNWHAARQEVSTQLDELEGAEANATFQQFLSTVHTLAAERRLSRLAYSASKPITA
jgi:cyclopropane fatty-acyl-phospholipid synthase-like methyltransferase